MGLRRVRFLLAPIMGVSPSESPCALAVAMADQLVEGAHALRLRAQRPAGAIFGVPGVQIQVQPGPGRGDETLEEQRRDDRAGKWGGRYIIKSGDTAAGL